MGPMESRLRQMILQYKIMHRRIGTPYDIHMRPISHLYATHIFPIVQRVSGLFSS